MDAPASQAFAAAALWAGFNLLLLLILSGLVTRQRRKHRIALGDEGVPELARAVRAFGNATEYAPAGMAALAVLAIAGAPALMVHLVGATLLGGRVAHAIGFGLTGGPSIGRSLGMVLTWLAWLTAAVWLIILGLG